MCPKFELSILGCAPFVFLGHFGLWDVKNDETLPNFIKKKAQKKGREKETRNKDQSLCVKTNMGCVTLQPCHLHLKLF
jgi:hypothetical protein